MPLSQLNDFAPLKCSTPAVDSSLKICNGIPQNEQGLIELCAFSDFPFYTCVRFSVSVWFTGTLIANELGTSMVVRLPC